MSELDDPQALLSNPNVIPSTTEFSIEEIMNADRRVHLYYLNFTWKSPGMATRYRGLVVEKYHTIKPRLPHVPLRAHRGWTDQTLSMVETWMHNCQEQHTECRALNAWKTSNSTFQPKRIVDIGTAGQSMWRLILREEVTIPTAPFVTLSHRWSPNQHVKLVSGNIQLYTSGQPLEILPQLFQDAIKVVKSLGIRYLWVDCLCIIQDSLSDWETESLEMCKIYTNSVCNMSITGFEDHSSGFLDKTSDYVPLPYRVQPRWAPEINEGWCVLDPFFWWAQVTKAPLTKRGWVFQERFLAPSVIHFGPEQILWECASLDACEAFPQGLPPIVESPRHTGFKRLDFLFEKDAHQSILNATSYTLSLKEDDLLYHWCQIVQSYTRTNLTKPNDKLIALAGVAQLISMPNNSADATSSKRYLAGLFEQHLLLMLEWHTDGHMFSRIEPPGVRPPQYRAPSWSWASIDGRVFYDYLPARIDGIELWNRKTSWRWYLEGVNSKINSREDTSYWPIAGKCMDWKPLVFDIKSSTTPSGGSPFGQISDGTVELTGRLISIRDVLTSSSDGHPSPRPIIVYLDTLPASGQVDLSLLLLPLRCIQLRSRANDPPFYWSTCLLLKTLDSAESTYQRCGMLAILSTEGVRQIGVELTDNPFSVNHLLDSKLEAIRII